MSSTTYKTFDDILTDMVSWILAHSSQISDLSAGSVIRSFCEATALSVEELNTAMYLGFKRELQNLKESVFSFSKKSGTKATVSLVFTRTSTDSTDTAVVIPAGTRVKTSSGLRFTTNAEGSIAVGSTTSSAIVATAEEVGYSYNVLSGTVTILEDDIDGVESVTNAAAASGGIDIETDASWHSRFQTYIEGLGRSSVAGLILAMLSDSRVTRASIVEQFPPVDNVNALLYVDDGSATGLSDEVIADLQAILDGGTTESDLGYRAAGINVVVTTPTIVSQAVTYSAVIDSTLDLDSDQVKTDIDAAITEYLNSLPIGGDIIKNKIIEAIMGIYGVVDCTVSTPAANVSISGSQVPRAGTISGTITSE